jgi:hypothetical protein
MSVVNTSYGGTAFVSPWPVIRVAFLLMATMVAACGDDTTTATAPSMTTKPAAENWSSVLAPGGTSSRSFTVTAAGTINVTMTNAGATVGLGVGLPRVSGGGCRLGVSVSTGGASTPQITTQADVGQYCVQVFDLGTLTDPISFTLTIDHP